MADHTGLRERKKARTRRTLIDTGLRLFSERGFEETTVADICALADLSTATFYKHFPAKEDLVFADQPRRIGVVRDLMAAREQARPLEEHALNVVRQVLEASGWDVDPDDELNAIRVQLITGVPVLRAIALRWLFDSQHEWALALAGAYPERLDEIDAHAFVGALVGAMVSAGIAATGTERAPSEVALHAARIALHGLAES